MNGFKSLPVLTNFVGFTAKIDSSNLKDFSLHLTIGAYSNLIFEPHLITLASKIEDQQKRTRYEEV